MEAKEKGISQNYQLKQNGNMLVEEDCICHIHLVTL